MENKNTPIEDTEKSVEWTEQDIIELIRKLRNDLIKDFLDERYLMAYFAEQYNRKEVTNRKVEFIRKELKEMLIEPVDLKHYAPLIEELRLSGTASLSKKHEGLFYKELERVFMRYVFY